MPQGLALRASNLLGSRAADMRPSSWREEDLSIELVAATENPTRMRVWEYDQEVYSYRSREFDEILDVSGMSQSDIDAFVGCPVLDSHSTWSTMEIVGVVDEARREGTELVVRIRLSKTEEDLVSKVRDGIVRKTSLGYQRRSGAVTTEREGDVPLRRQPFTPCEVSFVAVPADAGCGTRSLGSVAALARRSAPVSEPSSQDQTNMNVEAIRSAAAGLATSVAALQTALGVTAPTTATDDAARSAIEGATRSAPAPVVEPAAPASAPAPAQRAVSDEVAARATAVAGLRSAAVAVGADMTVFDGLAAGGEPLEGLRSLIKAKGPKTSDTEVNATRGASQEDLQGQPQFVGFDQAVSAQRGAAPSDIDKLAAALASRVARQS